MIERLGPGSNQSHYRPTSRAGLRLYGAKRDARSGPTTFSVMIARPWIGASRAANLT